MNSKLLAPVGDQAAAVLAPVLSLRSGAFDAVLLVASERTESVSKGKSFRASAAAEDKHVDRADRCWRDLSREGLEAVGEQIRGRTCILLAHGGPFEWTHPLLSILRANGASILVDVSRSCRPSL